LSEVCDDLKKPDALFLLKLLSLSDESDKTQVGKIELEVHAHKEQTGYLKLLVRG